MPSSLPNISPVTTLGFAMGVIVFLWGCNMPGIPFDGLEPPELNNASPAPQVCEKDQSICKYGSVQTCSADGTDFILEACPLDTSCSQGECVPIGERCDEGQPFALSVNELVFESTDLLKTQTRAVTLTNCGQRPIFIQRLDLRSPERADGNPVFVFASERPLMRELAPGDSLDIDIIYRPDGGLSQDRGWLELGVLGEGYVQAQIPMRTRSFCATTSPRKDLGLQPLDEGVEDTIYVHNCGTEALTLRQLVFTSEMDPATNRFALDPQALEDGSMTLPFVLEPGHFLRIPYRLEADRAGRWEGAITFELDEAARFSTEDQALDERAIETRVSAFFYRAPCKELGNTVVTTTGLSDSGYAEPFSPITLTTPGLPARYKTIFEITDHPDHGLAMPKGPSTFEPEVVGTYDILVHTLDDEDYIGCEPTALTLDVRPSAPLYIELLWRTIDDKIPDDEGFGRGVDLNLHLLASTDDSAPLTWNDIGDDCRPFTQRTGQPCPGLMADFVSTSRSGARPEAIAIDAPQGYFLQIGVHALNAYAFAGARAHLKVYRDGLLEPAFANAQATFDYTGAFWQAGHINGVTGESRATGLRPIPQMP